MDTKMGLPCLIFQKNINFSASQSTKFRLITKLLFIIFRKTIAAMDVQQGITSTDAQTIVSDTCLA